MDVRDKDKAFAKRSRRAQTLHLSDNPHQPTNSKKRKAHRTWVGLVLSDDLDQRQAAIT